MRRDYLTPVPSRSDRSTPPRERSQGRPADCIVKLRPSETAGQFVPALTRTSDMRRGDQADWYLNEPGFYRALGQRRIDKIRDVELLPVQLEKGRRVNVIKEWRIAK
ncbi:hypothetical protein NJB1604_00040 [Mycobacterium marinum]|nr:hypothetical protein NJB1604_00040 [Mycobacterium marinum]